MIDINKLNPEKIKENFNINWLRPENVPLNIHKYLIFKKHFKKIKNKSKLLEVGCGNGINTFFFLGGKFDFNFDFYQNSNTDFFFKNKDIFDFSTKNSKVIIKKKPKIIFDLAIDLRKNLISNAKSLNISKEYLVKDCNKKIIFKDKYDFIYSNIIYWLKNPYKSILEISNHLNKNGKFLLLLPNENFIKYCDSYTKTGKTWELLNRGRKKTMQIIINQASFEKWLKKNKFKIVSKEQLFSSLTLKIWDFGLRPISPFLIKMSNSITLKSRTRIKEEWCNKLFPIVKEVTENELLYGPKKGGYTSYLLTKNNDL